MRLTPVALTLATCAGLPCAAQSILETQAVHHASFGDQWEGDVVWADGAYFSVWMDRRVPGQYDIYAQRTLPTGENLWPGSRVMIRDAARIQSLPAVAWNGSMYLVCWRGDDALYAQRVTAAGAVLDPDGIVVSNDIVTSCKVASDGTNFLVTWLTNTGVRARRFSPAGVNLDPAPLTLGSGGGATAPRLAFGAGQYMVTWSASGAVQASRVLSSGAILNPGGTPIAPGVTGTPTPVFDGANFMVMFRKLDENNIIDLWSVFVTPELATISGPNWVADGEPWGNVGLPQMAFNGSRYLIPFGPPEPIFTGNILMAQLMDMSGFPIGGPFLVSDTEGEFQISYGVASNGTDFFVIFEDERNTISGNFVTDTRASRITPDGFNLDPDPEPLNISTSASWQGMSSSSFDGVNYLTFYEDRRTGPRWYDNDIYAMFVNTQAQPTTPQAFPVAAFPEGDQQYPEAVYGNNQHFVVYESPGPSEGQIRAARVLPSGQVLDPAGILVASSMPTGYLYRPQVAWSGSRYCIAFYDDYISGGTQPLRFRIMNGDGTPATGILQVPGSFFASFGDFDVTSDGSNFVIAWSDLETLRATRISPTGAILGTTNIASGGFDDYFEFAKVAWNGSSYLVSWRRYNDLGETIEARRLSATGQLLGSNLVLMPAGEGYYPESVNAIGDEFRVYWSIMGPPTSTAAVPIRRARISSAGAVVANEELLQIPSPEFYGAPGFGFAPSGQVLVTNPQWTDDPYNAPRLWVRAVGAGGPPPCYANCDASTTPPVLNIADFTCFLQRFAAADSYANCDQSTAAPVLNVADFTCFLQRFAAGCP